MRISSLEKFICINRQRTKYIMQYVKGQLIFYWDDNRLICVNNKNLNTFINQNSKYKHYCLYMQTYPFSNLVVGMEFKNYCSINNLTLSPKTSNLQFLSLSESEIKAKVNKIIEDAGHKILEGGVENFI